MSAKDIIRLNELVKDENINLQNMYLIALEEGLGFLDKVNDRGTIKVHVNEMIQKGVPVSHMIATLANSHADLFEVWLGNSIKTPSSIRTKQELKEALAY